MITERDEVWKRVRAGKANNYGIMFCGDAWYAIFKEKDTGRLWGYEASTKEKHSPGWPILEYTEKVYA